MVKNFSKSWKKGGTYMQLIKIKKMFQNMIFLQIIRLLVKEIPERKILTKKILSLGGGDLQAKNQNY